MDRLNQILLVAGLGCFVFAFLLSGLYPYMITDGKTPEATYAQVAQVVSPDFKDLKDAFPNDFTKAFQGAEAALTPRELATIPATDPRRAGSEDAWRKIYATALRDGRDLYIGEACWHCHSQYVRPVANEDVRWGPPSTTEQDNNALQRPVLWGTRRVGPDLTYEGGVRSNDWHIAHFLDPKSTSPGSIMPAYTWHFATGFEVRRKVAPDIADREGIAPDKSYSYPGIYDTKQEAEQAMERIRTSLPNTLAGERDRLFVAEATRPTAKLLSLIAYLQWLGTWQPQKAER